MDTTYRPFIHVRNGSGQHNQTECVGALALVAPTPVIIIHPCRLLGSSCLPSPVRAVCTYTRPFLHDDHSNYHAAQPRRDNKHDGASEQAGRSAFDVH